MSDQFELQLRIDGVWTTYSRPHALLAQANWDLDRRRWLSLAIRLLRNGKVIRRRL